MAADILVAVDFSAGAARALDVAREYARRLGARLHVLHVVWPGADPVTDPRLERLVAETGPAVPVVAAVASGRPAVEIVDYARRRAIELIVVGTHGRSGLSRALLGSVAEAVMRTAPCPVLAVPARETAAVHADEVAPLPPARCIVCAGESDDLICEPCRARIRGEAVDRKQREERAGRGGGT